mmetsp:Transcript_30984/g.28180  ORF Transcript_30984/g.28180 Transcript_30984/m.28180 type:complete len:172 (-) Transcript_30984:456-971(-)
MFNLPSILYDYKACFLRSSFITLDFGFIITTIISAAAGFAIFCSVIYIIFFTRAEMKSGFAKTVKYIVYFILGSAITILLGLFLVVSFDQIEHFSPTLFIENITFWIMMIMGVGIYIYQKMKRRVVFLSIEKIEAIVALEKKFDANSQNHVELQDEGKSDAKSESRSDLPQ